MNKWGKLHSSYELKKKKQQEQKGKGEKKKKNQNHRFSVSSTDLSNFLS